MVYAVSVSCPQVSVFGDGHLVASRAEIAVPLEFSQNSTHRTVHSPLSVQMTQTYTLCSLQTIIISRFLLNLRRAAQLRSSAPSQPSGIRSSIFRMPTIPDIVEDMGRPLDHGRYDCDVDEDVLDDSGATVAEQSLVQGSSAAGIAVTRSQAGGEIVELVRRL